MGLLRVLLALGVLLEHSDYAIGVGSYTAVQAFFVISGFYMQLILASGRYDAKGFYQSRSFRLYPAYFAVVLVGLVVYLTAEALGVHTTVFTYAERADITVWQWIYVVFANLFVVGSDAVWFFPTSFPGVHPIHLLIIPPVWTISLELVFYAICPWLAKQRTGILLAMIVMFFLARFIGYHNGLDDNPWHSRFIGFELAYFLLGMVSCRMYLRGWRGGLLAPVLTAAVFGVVLFLPEIVSAIKMPVVYSRENYLHSMIFYATVFLALPYLFEKTRNSRLDEYIGEYSYLLYLTHYIFVAVLLHSKVLSGGLAAFVIVLASFAVSAAIVHFVQKPVDNFRHRRFRKTPPDS